VAEPIPQTLRRSARWTTPAEEQVILGWLGDPDLAGYSVGEVFTRAWDAGTYVASMRTWYRVARRHQLVAKTRRSARQPPRAIPQLVARRAHQLWSWDITKLPARYVGQSFEFYVVIDVYSRFIVAHRVEPVESDVLAKAMFTDAFNRFNVTPEMIHSDGGPSMTSTTLKELFEQLTITQSKNRPRVSNDNPYSEAWFKTAKYHPSYPEQFDTINEAITWADNLVDWYNHEHRHSGIAWHTPASVLTGDHQRVQAERQAVLDQHYQAHTHRYTERPTVPDLPIEVWINQPERRLQID
jgi:putative transposase